jgi:hypothetical protein
MSLLRCSNSSEFDLTKDLVSDNTILPYTIFSYSWRPDTADVTSEDMINGAGKDKPGYEKIQFC